MGVKAFHCDNVSQEFDDSQLPIVKEWIEKRDNLVIEKTERIDNLMSDLAAKEEKVTVLVANEAKLQTRIEELEGQLQTLKAELEKRSDSTVVATQTKERRKLERLICSRLDSVSDDDLDALTDRGLKETFINHHYDFPDLNNRSDEAINGMFDMAIRYADSQSFTNQANKAGTIVRQDSSQVDISALMNAKRVLRG